MVDKETIVGLLFLLFLLNIFYWILQGLQMLFPLPIALGLIVLMLYWLLKVGVSSVIYPGSSWYFKRHLENVFCKDHTAKLLIHIKDIGGLLESIRDSGSQDSFQLIPISSSVYKEVTEHLDILKTLRDEKSISKKQLALLTLLNELDSLVSRIHMSTDKTKISLTEYLLSTYKPSDFKIEEESSVHVLEAINKSNDLQLLLLESCGTVNKFNEVLRWLFDDTLGSLTYLRVETLKRYNAEQLWIPGKDGVLLDCMWIPGKNNEHCILFCNANAGYYECCHYQVEWVEFYVRLGLGVMMWNYRGYGRSSGYPDLNDSIVDGECILNHLKQKEFSHIGLHGQSLGGAVATCLASKVTVDFLFADRTFWSLADVVRFGYGKAACWIFETTENNPVNVARHFLQAQCYKVCSADFLDTMIPDLASLKAGVAYELLIESINSKDYNMYQSALIHRLSYIVDSSLAQSFLAALSNLAKEEHTSDVISVLKVCSKLRAGGKPLFGVLQDEYSYLSLLMWLVQWDIWEKPSEKLMNVLNVATSQLSFMQNQYKNWGDLETIVNFIDKLRSHLESKKSDNFLSDIYVDNSCLRSSVSYEKGGHLLALQCGHSGNYLHKEKQGLLRHLARVGFIS